MSAKGIVRDTDDQPVCCSSPKRRGGRRSRWRGPALGRTGLGGPSTAPRAVAVPVPRVEEQWRRRPALATGASTGAADRMLHDIETGYEGRFDFPPFAGKPKVAYLLASVPRAGSTFFS